MQVVFHVSIGKAGSGHRHTAHEGILHGISNFVLVLVGILSKMFVDPRLDCDTCQDCTLSGRHIRVLNVVNSAFFGVSFIVCAILSVAP